MIVARAPLRMSLGGGGTDLPSYYRRFGASFLAAAIDKHVYVFVGRPVVDELVRVAAPSHEEVHSVGELNHELARAVLQFSGIERQVGIYSMSDVPAGTGLGSSSAYVVAALVALDRLLDRPLDREDLAGRSAHVEMEVAGHPVGKQDHVTAVFGGLRRYDIDRAGRVTSRPVDVAPERLTALNDRILLFYTGITRQAGRLLAEQQRRTHADDPDVVESLHRTRALGHEIEGLLVQGDLDGIGPLLHEHWTTKKRRSQGVSDPRIDRCYDEARAAGAIGGKVLGAGGGGFLMLCCSPPAAGDVRAAMAAGGLIEMRYRFADQGAQVLLDV